MADGRRLRVGLEAHVIGRRGAGNETYTVGLAHALGARRDIDLVLYLERGVPWADAQARVRRLVFRRAQARMSLEVPLRTRLDRLDLLHTQYVVPAAPGVPVVTMVHDLSYLDEPALIPSSMRWRLRATVADAARRAAVLLTPSAFSRDRLLHHYPAVAPDRVVVTPTHLSASLPHLAPAHGDEARDGADGHGARGADGQVRDLGLPDRFVLAVGDQHPRKNLPRLVAAIAQARRRGFDGGLVLAGQPGWRQDEVKRAIERHDAGAWVRLLGWVPAATLARLYRAARLVAYVSLYEGFGLPVLEAMTAGTPVVASARGAIPEIAGDAALLVDPVDPSEIADAVLRLSDDGSLRASLVAAGRNRVHEFRPEVGAEATVQAYQLALAR